MTLLNIWAMLRRACKTALIYEEDEIGIVKVGFYDAHNLPEWLLPREVIAVHENSNKDELVVTLARPEE